MLRNVEQLVIECRNVRKAVDEGVSPVADQVNATLESSRVELRDLNNTPASLLP